MKKLFMFAAALAVLGAPSAFADNHGGDKGGKKGAMFEKHDTNADGAISKAEFLAHAEARFDKMDADGNGEVSKDEAKAAHEAKREKRKERKEKRKERKDASGE